MRSLFIGAAAVIATLSLASCATVHDIQESELGKTVGSFEFNPVAQNTYWYDGRSYEYNRYAIEISSAPVNARILWNGRPAGTTPFVFEFSGTLDRDEYVTVRAMPLDERYEPQEATLRIRQELPRKIEFSLKKK